MISASWTRVLSWVGVASGRFGPVAPSGVRVVQPDGCEVPLRLVRIPDEGGLRVWMAFGPAGVELLAGFTVRVDVLPAPSAVRLAVWRGRGDALVFAEEV